MDHIAITATQPCGDSVAATTELSHVNSEHGCVPIKLYLQKQGAGQIQASSGNLPNPAVTFKSRFLRGLRLKREMEGFKREL